MFDKSSHKPLIRYPCDFYNYSLIPLRSEVGEKKEEEKLLSQTKKVSTHKQFGGFWSDIQSTEKPLFRIDIDKEFYAKIYGEQKV
jgi:hypothetical protein